MSNFSTRVLACCLKSREAYEQLKVVTDLSVLSPEATYLMGLIEEFYKLDADSTAVDIATLKDRVALQQDKDSKVEALHDRIDETLGVDVSVINFVEMQKEAKRTSVSDDLIQALTDKSKADKVSSLIEVYQRLDSLGNVYDDESEMYHDVSVEDSLEGVLDEGMRMYLAPSPLMEHTTGCVPGDHILICARPEMGKTAMCATASSGFAFTGHRGLVLGNEDAIQRIVARYQMCLTGMTADEMRADPKKANELLKVRGWNNIRFIQLTPGTPAEVEKYVNRYKPSWFLVDQIRNLIVKKTGTRAEELESVAKYQRDTGLKHNAVTVSVTQAGETASGKRIVTMSDIDGSKTGIPGAIDLFVGVGADAEYALADLRMINLDKNKLSGKHVHFPVRINRSISRVEEYK